MKRYEFFHENADLGEHFYEEPDGMWVKAVDAQAHIDQMITDYGEELKAKNHRILELELLVGALKAKLGLVEECANQVEAEILENRSTETIASAFEWMYDVIASDLKEAD